MAIMIANRTGQMGLGDAALLLNAQQQLTRAGYEGVGCREERVYMPDGSFYTQNVCSAPGFVGGFDANIIARGGVDLAAERASLIANRQWSQADNPQQYFDTFGAGSIPVISVGPDRRVITNPQQTAPTLDVLIPHPGPTSVSVQMPASQPQQTNASPVTQWQAPSSTSTDNTKKTETKTTFMGKDISGFTSNFSEMPSWVWLAALAGGALLFVGGKR